MRNDALWIIGDTLIGKSLKPDGRTRFHTFQDALEVVEDDQPGLGGPAVMREFGRFDRPVATIGA